VVLRQCKNGSSLKNHTSPCANIITCKTSLSQVYLFETTPAGCLRINPRKKAPNFNKLGAFGGRFDKLWVDCREGGRF
jgi:hypothetical protein